ncbi:MAG: histidine kinase [Bacteroidota bacterium]
MEYEVILAATITLLVLVTIIIALLAIFQDRKNKYLLAEKKFEDEIAKSQMEITEQALKNISWELHDNVGQLLSIAKMQLNILHSELQDQAKVLDEVSELVGKSLMEIRLLSKTLNPESILNMGLVQAVQVELDRFDKLKFVATSLAVEGNVCEIGQRDEIIIFRILQEFFTNVIKHSKADLLKVKLNYLSDKVIIIAEDDGIGFDADEVVQGSGLMNMMSRAKLIGAAFERETKPGNGVKMYLEYPYKDDKR